MVVGSGGFILGGGGRWWDFFGWWWVVVGLFWWWWVVDGIFWVVVGDDVYLLGSGGYFLGDGVFLGWVVVGDAGWWHGLWYQYHLFTVHLLPNIIYHRFVTPKKKWKNTYLHTYNWSDKDHFTFWKNILNATFSPNTWEVLNTLCHSCEKCRNKKVLAFVRWIHNWLYNSVSANLLVNLLLIWCMVPRLLLKKQVYAMPIWAFSLEFWLTDSWFNGYLYIL